MMSAKFMSRRIGVVCFRNIAAHLSGWTESPVVTVLSSGSEQPIKFHNVNRTDKLET